LHELLHGSQLWGAGLIVVGGILLSLELSGSVPKLKKRLFLLMLGSSVCYAINGVVFKAIAVHQGFLDSLFWDMAGKVFLGVLLFVLIKSYRLQFVHLIKVNRFSIISLGMLTETLSVIGETAMVLAVLFVPVALAQSIGGLQPLFVFIIGVLITLFLPKLGQESLTGRHLAQKIFGIGIISAGVYLLGVI